MRSTEAERQFGAGEDIFHPVQLYAFQSPNDQRGVANANPIHLSRNKVDAGIDAPGGRVVRRQHQHVFAFLYYHMPIHLSVSIVFAKGW